MIYIIHTTNVPMISLSKKITSQECIDLKIEKPKIIQELGKWLEIYTNPDTNLITLLDNFKTNFNVLLSGVWPDCIIYCKNDLNTKNVKDKNPHWDNVVTSFTKTSETISQNKNILLALKDNIECLNSVKIQELYSKEVETSYHKITKDDSNPSQNTNNFHQQKASIAALTLHIFLQEFFGIKTEKKKFTRIGSN